jgi:hypothetical protein
MALEELQLIEQQIGKLDQEMASLLGQHQDAVKRLAEVPGPGSNSAQQIIVVSCLFARHRSLVSGSCSSASIFAPRFFRAPPRGECDFTFALLYDFTSIRLSKGLSPSSCQTCSAHKHKTPDWHRPVRRIRYIFRK